MKLEKELGNTSKNILKVLRKIKGKKISVRELAKRMDELANYTWVLEKAKELNNDGFIEMAEEIYESGYNNIKSVSKVVWVKRCKKKV